ncbi:hypothetical protein [Micromonospora peucetia]|uniref:RDD family protein n=1 Tax=Micromonospora peucetia TaxID=47871 RepID=A0ABZ1E765_9ACTN|nr:hypothetical protein [Micromonospora peucetia]WSA30636.1 hypothetical protein OIE14_20950 [Micromonospora peucetia]
MAEMSPRKVRRLGRLFMLGFPLFELVFDFVLLLVTYLVLASIVPNVLGEVAVSPARFAAWIALVRLPMTLAYTLAVSWRGWMALVTRGEVLDPPVRKGWRRALVRVRDWGADAAWSVMAALIVFDHVADPGDARVWQLVAATAVGPFLLPKSVRGLFWLLRWWWRRRRIYRARHARPDEETINV